MNTILRRALLLLLLLAGLPGVGSAQISDGSRVTVKSNAKGSDFCLDALWNKKVKFMRCNHDDDDSNIWYVKPSKDWYTIHAASLGDRWCLEMDQIDYGLMNGCGGGDSQKFRVDENSQGSFSVRNKKYFKVSGSDFCLGPAPKSFGINAFDRLTLYECTYSGTQFVLSRAQ